jgi:hypothetical protein
MAQRIPPHVIAVLASLPTRISSNIKEMGAFYTTSLKISEI